MPEQTTKPHNDIKTSLTRHYHLALAIFLAFFGIGGAYLSHQSIASAIVANGQLVTSTNVKSVQHERGGTVEAIHVVEGQTVSKGDILVQLNADLQNLRLLRIKEKLSSLKQIEWRLKSEIASLSNSDQFETRDELLQTTPDNIQSRLLLTNLAKRANSKARLSRQISQLKQEKQALRGQLKTVEAKQVFFDQQKKISQQLLSKGHTSPQQMRLIDKQKAELEGEAHFLNAKSQGTEERIQSLIIERKQVDNLAAGQLLAHLHQIKQQQTGLQADLREVKERLSRATITAPHDGIIHQVTIHTIGAAIKPAQILMQIVPTKAPLIIETRIAQQDREQVHIGMPVRIRIGNWRNKQAPDKTGNIIHLSANAIKDRLDGQAYFKVRISVPHNLDDGVSSQQTLHAGMPVDLLVETQSRTILSYLLKPITDQWRKALRES